MKIDTVAFLCAMALIGAASDCFADVTSTFAFSSEGWVSVMLAYPQPSAPPTPLGSSPYTPNYGTYGTPAEKGVSLLDPDGNSATGNTQYWSAPAKFLGNQAQAYGGSIAYDLIDTNVGDGPYAEEDAILVGGGLTLVYVLPMADWPDGTTNWKRITIPLTEAGWTISSPSGTAATADNLKTALASLKHLYMRAEYQLGPDTAYLANVDLKYAPSTSIQPSSLIAGSASFTLTVNGSNFLSSDTVAWNGVPLNTTYVSSSRLTAQVPAGDVAVAGSAAVSVVNTVSGDQTTNPALFAIPLTSLAIASESIKTNAGGYSITLTLKNTGFNAATNVLLTGAYLANTASSTALPIDIASLAPLTTETVTLNFPSSAGNAGDQEFLVLDGSYAGGAIVLTSVELLP